MYLRSICRDFWNLRFFRTREISTNAVFRRALKYWDVYTKIRAEKIENYSFFKKTCKTTFSADSNICGKCLYFTIFYILVSLGLALQFGKTQNWTKHRYTSGIFRVLANLTKIRANSPTFFRENKNPAKSLCFPCKFIRISRTRSPTRRRTPSRRQTHPPQGREALKCFRKVQGKLSPIFWFRI